MSVVYPGKKSKDLIETYRNRVNKKDTIKANLSYLKRVSKPMVKYDLIRSIIEKKTNKAPVPTSGAKKSKKPAAEPSESVFTEKDFQDFQRSYFGVNN